jgi:hypothetical protein
MAKLVTAVLCDDVRHEAAGKTSLMGIFTQWIVGDYTTPLPPFHVFVRLAFDAESDHQCEIEFRSIEGQQIFLAQSLIRLETIDAATQLYFANVDLGLTNLLIPRPGQYEFAIRVDNELITSIPCGAITITPRLVQ